MNEEELIKKIEEKIQILVNEFEKYPNSFHYEGDVVAKLYYLLSDIPEFVKKDREGDQSLHCETPLPKDDKEPNPRMFDLTMLNSENNPFIAIECKLNETNIKEIEKDFNKLNDKENNVKFPFVILLVKKDIKYNQYFKEDIDELKEKYPRIIFITNKNW